MFYFCDQGTRERTRHKNPAWYIFSIFVTIGTSGNGERQVGQEKNGFNTEYESISLTYRFYMNFSGNNKSAELQQICLFSLQADFMLFISVVVSQMWRLEYKCVLLH